MPLDIAPPKRDLPRVTARRFDKSDVLRLCGWGSSALLAVGALFLATQAEVYGAKRDTTSAPPLKPEVVAQTPAPPKKDPEIAGLLAEMRILVDDRRRLSERVAVLEQQLTEVTGSIRQRAAAPAEQPAPKAPEPVAAANQAPPPAVAAVESTAAATALAPVPTAAIPKIDPLAMPASTGSIGGWPDIDATDQDEVQQEQPLTVAPKLESREIRPVPVPLAALVPQERTPAPKPVHRSEYGIDLGGARDMEALRERWVAIKANLGPLLTGLQPIAVRDKKPGSTELRLVVGPMPNLAAARQVCTRFAAAKVHCQASRFDGDAVVQR